MSNISIVAPSSIFQDMADFDKKYGFDKQDMTPEFLAFRMRFLLEEYIEGVLAMESGDAEGFVDSMVDLIVVAAGTLSIGKVDSQRAWDRVHEANMNKIRANNPARSGSGGADLIKPNGWKPPDHSDNLGLFNYLPTRTINEHFPHSITVLLNAVQLQIDKANDYNSSVPRASYWIHGLDDFEYELHKKHTRFRTVLDLIRRGAAQKFESLYDTFMDQINYLSFAAAWFHGKEPGQTPERDLFNRPKKEDEE